MVGFYVSGHPLDLWQSLCEQWLGWSTEHLKKVALEKKQSRKTLSSSLQGGAWNERPWQKNAKTEIKIAGLLFELKEITTKKGQRMAFSQLEDLKGKMEVIYFPDVFSQLQEVLKKAIAEAEVVLLTGEGEWGEDTPKILAKNIENLEDAHRNCVQKLVFHLSPNEIDPEQMRELKKEILQNRGKGLIRLDFSDSLFRARMDLSKNFGVTVTPLFVQSVNQIFKKEVVEIC